MKLFLKRLSIYWLCFFVSYMPYRSAHALAPLAAVVVDVVAGSVVSWATSEIVTRGVCGKKPWAANDPVFLCNAKTTKNKWLNKAKGSAKWIALFAAAGYIVYENNFYKSEDTAHCSVPSQFLPGDSITTFSTCFDGYKRWLSYLNEPDVYVTSPLVEWNRIVFRYVKTYSDGTYSVHNSAGSWKSTVNSEALSDGEFFEDFWKTSPKIDGEMWLPDDLSQPQIHPEPDWFPQAVPVSQPVFPSTSPEITPYPKELPATHPHKRPNTDPAPDYLPEDWPEELPGSWPADWPSPGSVPGTSPGEFPNEWPLPGSRPVFEPNPNPNPEPNPNPNPEPLPFPIPLPVIGPMTRTEFEQVQARNAQEALNGLPEPDFKTPAQQITDAMNDFLSDKVDIDIPEFSFSPFGYFSYGGGSCIAFDFDLSLGGKRFHATFDAHCKPFEQFVRPTLEWSLYLTTGLYIYMLFTRTVRSM
ncbi:hypothetical protein [Vibrio cincinnatiensis]